MSNRDPRLYIEDILESIVKIKDYTKGMTLEVFSVDPKTVDAVVRNFEIIGEASRQLPDDVKEKYHEIKWKDLIDFRNVVIHEYYCICRKELSIGYKPVTGVLSLVCLIFVMLALMDIYH